MLCSSRITNSHVAASGEESPDCLELKASLLKGIQRSNASSSCSAEGTFCSINKVFRLIQTTAVTAQVFIFKSNQTHTQKQDSFSIQLRSSRFLVHVNALTDERVVNYLTETTNGEMLLDSLGQALASSLGPCALLLPSSHPRSHKALFIAAGGRERQPWKKKSKKLPRSHQRQEPDDCLHTHRCRLTPLIPQCCNQLQCP